MAPSPPEPLPPNCGNNNNNCSQTPSPPFNKLCSTLTTVIIVSIVIATVVVSVVVGVVLYQYRMRIQIALYMLKWKVKKRLKDVSVNTHFDTYVIYNDNCRLDRQYVVRDLCAIAEDELGQNMFIWDRNAKIGSSMAESIVEGMASSRKILIIHSAGLFTNDIPNVEGDQPDMANPNDVVSVDQISVQKRQNNEWMDFSLLTAMRFIKEKPICVITNDEFSPKSVPGKWHPLLYPNMYLSPITVIRSHSHHFSRKLKSFLIN